MNVAIIIILLLIFLIQFILFILSLLGPKPMKPLDFERDILFLNFLIGRKIEDYRKYVITPSKAAGRGLLTDKEIEEYTNSLPIQIISELSSNYIRTLYKYFSEDGLRFYICNTINNSLSDLVLKHNLSFLNSVNGKKNDVTNVSKNDIE